MEQKPWNQSKKYSNYVVDKTSFMKPPNEKFRRELSSKLLKTAMISQKQLYMHVGNQENSQNDKKPTYLHMAIVVKFVNQWCD